MTLNKAQQVALFRVFCRHNPSAADNFPGWQRAYRRFRRTVSIGRDYAMVQWAGMYLGIELDGYTHS
jgi:hypothetical protein